LEGSVGIADSLAKEQINEQKKTLLFCFNSALNVAKTAFWREKTAKNVENLLEGWSVASEKQLLVHEYEHEH
jgi:hypothetical protein